jgi:hypothetical protein
MYTDDYKLISIIPTEEMIEVACNTYNSNDGSVPVNILMKEILTSALWVAPVIKQDFEILRSPKDHEVAQFVTSLTNTAIEYKDSQQLRNRLRHLVLLFVDQLKNTKQ